MKVRDEKKSGVDEGLVASVVRAREEGRLMVGGLDLEPTSAEELADLEVEAQLYRADRERGIPVIVRLSPEALEWLRAEADRVGVRGWRKLLMARVQAMTQ